MHTVTSNYNVSTPKGIILSTPTPACSHLLIQSTVSSTNSTGRQIFCQPFSQSNDHTQKTQLTSRYLHAQISERCVFASKNPEYAEKGVFVPILDPQKDCPKPHGD